ncbi:hypothetical protein [Aquipuribacter nitratireducens]|uniref:Uncharacterized protein n=1 Tax=Aquipuribacter nitratireducens TaxID=650104 RepID=A0ABW0GL39_9MICO
MTGEERAPQEERGSPLGRYEPHDDATTDGATVHVVLRGLPVQVWLASREHHDDLMREYRLLALAGDLEAHHAPARLVELVEILGQRYAAAASRRDEELEAALAAGLAVIDQESDVTPAAVGAVRELRRLMAESDRFCEEAQLLTLPRPPVVRDFGEWFLDEFERQLEGHAPTPWDGPLTP